MISDTEDRASPENMAQHTSICALRCFRLVDVSQVRIDTHPYRPASASGEQRAQDELGHCPPLNPSLS